jgi:hypothetical protein
MKKDNLQEDKVHLEYFISDKNNPDVPSPQVYKKFKNTYIESFILSEEIKLNEPKVTGVRYIHNLRGVALAFNSFNPNKGKCLTSKISFYGQEEKINDLVKDMKEKFHMEEY